MVSIGTAHGRRMAALITDMDKPLGHNIGNALEVAESMAVLQGRGPADLTEVCLQLAANMLVLAGKGDLTACRAMAERALADGTAFEKCCQMFEAQGGDTRVLCDPGLFAKAPYCYDLVVRERGGLYHGQRRREDRQRQRAARGRAAQERRPDRLFRRHHATQ